MAGELMATDTNEAEIIYEVPQTDVKLEGPGNYRQWCSSLHSALEKADPDIVRYIYLGNEPNQHSNPDRKKRAMRRVFSHLINVNVAASVSGLPVEVEDLTRDVMVNEHRKFLVQTLDQRAKSLFSFAAMKRENRMVDFYRASALNEVTQFENLIVEIINWENLDFSAVKDILVYLVKSHNYIRGNWRPETFVGKIYNFSTDITDCIDVSLGPTPELPFGDSLAVEYDNLVVYLRDKGYSRYFDYHQPAKLAKFKCPSFSAPAHRLKRLAGLDEDHEAKRRRIQRASPCYMVLSGQAPGIYFSEVDCHKAMESTENGKVKRCSNLNEAEFYADLWRRREKIYIDGSFRKDPKSGISPAGYGIYFGPYSQHNKSIPLSLVDDVNKNFPSCQRAELHALVHALRYIRFVTMSDYKPAAFEILTDSKYCKRCINEWAPNWLKNGWKTLKDREVANRDLISQAYSMHKAINKNGGLVFITHVRGHSGEKGNEMADLLAREGVTKMLLAM